ncbi:hypothetical protein [Chryseobacterium lathyri]|uniref:Uncharacterized protein n=1 Tax=Chryseobacterium lathyri TaxID=395933 RepID=A0A511YFZ0_9FLAO|nr:hypothetical protein [Chryseobacterium lathyri]GEN74114.1 hypothetical protein CLA01_41860 [Chryseobacterium lathyri]
MSQSYFGSIDFDKLMTDLKAGRLKTYRTESGKRLVNINIYVNDNPDQYGNIASVSVPLKEEFHTEENGKKINKLYIGNLKPSENSITEGSGQDFQNDDDDDLPF